MRSAYFGFFMKKVGVLFPGQGSQYVGMGKDLCDSFRSARNVFKKADEILGFSLSKLCFEGPVEDLTLTHNSQPAIYVVSLAAYLSLIERYPDFRPSVLAGLSLGEFSALTVAGIFSLEEGISLVRSRGLFMQEAVENNPGSMASIIGLNTEQVFDLCQEVTNGIVVVANLNSPGQIVISGEREAVGAATILAKEKGARRAIELNVSGAFHSPLMEGAREKLAEEIEKISLKEPDIPVVFNVSGESITDVPSIKKAVISQVTSPVRWLEVMNTMIQDFSIKKFLEVGSGTVLKGLAKKIDPEVVVNNVSDSENLETAIETFEAIEN